jgi:hypothetical protein
MKKVAVVMLLAAGLCAQFAHAQDEPATQPAAGDAKHQQAAERLSEAMSQKDPAKAALVAAAPMVDHMAMQFQLDKEGAAELKGIFEKWFSEDFDYAAIKQQVVARYAEKFTTKELNELPGCGGYDG